LDHRQRVLEAIELREVDRVPRDLGSVGSLMVDPVYFKVKKLLGIETDIKPYRQGSTANYYDERVLEAMDIDFRHLWFDSPDKPKLTKNTDGTVTDDWGITWSKYGSYPSVFPLQNSSHNELKGYIFPSASKNWNLNALSSRAEDLYNNTDYAIAAKSVLGGGGILERAYYLRGIEELFTDMYMNKKFVWDLLERITEVEISYWDVFLGAVGPYIHIIERASDLGTQLGLFISPGLYREFLKPFEKMIIKFLKSKAPHAKMWFHSCGAISELIEDFIDNGVEILNPVQPLAKDMDSVQLKKKFGDRICFHGGIDLQKAMIGTIEDVKNEVERRVKAFAPGGGYILAPANHIQEDVPAENVVFLYNYAKEFGKYPIKKC